MAEYLYSVLQREQQQQTGFDDGSLFGQRRNPLYPVSGFDFSTLGPMRQVNPVISIFKITNQWDQMATLFVTSIG